MFEGAFRRQRYNLDLAWNFRIGKPFINEANWLNKIREARFGKENSKLQTYWSQT